MKPSTLLEPASAPDPLAARAARTRRAWTRLGLHLQTVTPRGLLRFALATSACAVIVWLLWGARDVLLPFVVGAALAYVIAPLVDVVARHLPRGAAFVVVFGGVLLVVAAFLVYLAPILQQQVLNFAGLLPNQDQLLRWTQSLHLAIAHLPRDAQNAIDSLLVQIGAEAKAHATAMAQQFVAVTAGVVFNVVNTVLVVLGFAIVPVWLFFVFESGAGQRTAAYHALPAAIREDVWAVLRIADRVFSSWIRGQIILSLSLGVSVAAGLYLLALLGVRGLQDILLLALVAALTAPIPYVGSFVAPLPAVAMALTQSWQGALAVLILYVILENIYTNVLSPKVMGTQLNIDPAILMPLLLVLGRFGLLWMILAGPLAAVARDVFLYLYGRAADPPRPAGQLPGDGASPSPPASISAPARRQSPEPTRATSTSGGVTHSAQG